MKYTVTISENDRNTYRKDNGLCVAWAWACEQFGRPSGQNQRWNFDTHLRFFFRDKQDAVMFALRWGTGVDHDQV
jgi:hypothetical protein